MTTTISGRWEPISSAPKKDGSYIIVAGPSGYTSTPLRAEVCCWSYNRNGWVNHAFDRFTDGGDEPTLWMPLPEIKDLT